MAQTDPTACTKCGAHPGTEFLWGENGCAACPDQKPNGGTALKRVFTVRCFGCGQITAAYVPSTATLEQIGHMVERAARCFDDIALESSPVELGGCTCPTPKAPDAEMERRCLEAYDRGERTTLRETIDDLRSR